MIFATVDATMILVIDGIHKFRGAGKRWIKNEPIINSTWAGHMDAINMAGRCT